METEEASQGVSNCYIFKSRLQEYAQRVGLSTPFYETIKEGPSHQPTFRSTVIVNDIRYDSLPGFSNRKAAEQSAAEVALVKMVQSGEMSESLAQPLHESGLCKNLLQEYAQKMNYGMPLYEFQKDERQGRETLFSCTVEIGGIRYIGGSARTKKEAEIKAARTALLAIQSSVPKVPENNEYTVLPKRKQTNSGLSIAEPTSAALKAKNRRAKKRKIARKKKHQANGTDYVNGKNKNNRTVNTSMQVTDPECQSSEASNTIHCGNKNKEISVVLPNNGDSAYENLSSAYVNGDVQVTDSGFPSTEASNTIQYGNGNKENSVVLM